MKLVNGIISQAQNYRIIIVRGTLACGKTTLIELVANKLFEIHGKIFPIHVLNGWNKEEVEGAGDWKAYLEKKTGVHGGLWPLYPTYLLLDEAQ